MGFFRVDKDRETVTLWKQKCKKIERERDKYRNAYILLEKNMNRAKSEYEALIAEVKELRKRQVEKLEMADELANEYKKELQSILKKVGKE